VALRISSDGPRILTEGSADLSDKAWETKREQFQASARSVLEGRIDAKTGSTIKHGTRRNAMIQRSDFGIGERCLRTRVRLDYQLAVSEGILQKAIFHMGGMANKGWVLRKAKISPKDHD